MMLGNPVHPVNHVYRFTVLRCRGFGKGSDKLKFVEQYMNYRRFGRTSWQVSEIGYGMWGMGGWTGSDDEESLSSLQRAVDLGCNFFDTAWAYGEGKSERLLGQLIRRNDQKKLYTATKVPPKNGTWPSRRGFTLDDTFPPDYIEQRVPKPGAFRTRVSTDAVPCLGRRLAHRWSKKMDELCSQGLIKSIGISINRWEPWNGLNSAQRSD
jgi:aryl-alcohol dehydrogenase-like predicted oxidoreductase